MEFLANGARRRPLNPSPISAVRLSRLLPKSSSDEEAVPLRRVLLWALVAVGIVVGLVLYFIYERQITPLVG